MERGGGGDLGRSWGHAHTPPAGGRSGGQGGSKEGGDRIRHAAGPARSPGRRWGACHRPRRGGREDTCCRLGVNNVGVSRWRRKGFEEREHRWKGEEGLNSSNEGEVKIDATRWHTALTLEGVHGARAIERLPVDGKPVSKLRKHRNGAVGPDARRSGGNWQ